MRAYIIRRLLLMIPTLFILTVLVFLAVRFIPGDIIDLMLGQMQYQYDDTFDREALERMLDWTCLFTCSMGAGSEISFCAALLAPQWLALFRSQRG